ncbi:hypothetical protein RJ640_015508 [Escallonia rubra]|uniref:Uncharacterized protein n=1 Tax=Escallonia rubra TaxID=112253 RepID=A0AA88RKV2_9ASTE|nr:hypothetical protein RJ640_015508 [Escallonia rubra]
MSSWASRWVELNFSLPTSMFRWPRLLSSYFTPEWSPRGPTWASEGFWGFSPRGLNGRSLRGWWPELDFSIVDTVVWSFVTALESVALVSMLCFFFVFCGCTI